MRRFAKAWAASALGGVGVWGLCRALNGWLGFAVAFSPAALAVCTVLGMPGAAALLLTRVLFMACGAP